MIWRRVSYSKGWYDFKYENIDLEEHKNGRPFVWVEDELLPQEHEWLEKHGWTDNYFYTNIFKDSYSLVKTLEKLKECKGCRRSYYICYYEPRIIFPVNNFLSSLFAPKGIKE